MTREREHRARSVKDLVRRWFGRDTTPQVYLIYADELHGQREFVWGATPSRDAALAMVSRPSPFPGTETWFMAAPWIRDADPQGNTVFVVMFGEPDNCLGKVVYSSRQSAEDHATLKGGGSLFVLPMELTA